MDISKILENATVFKKGTDGEAKNMLAKKTKRRTNNGFPISGATKMKEAYKAKKASRGKK